VLPRPVPPLGALGGQEDADLRQPPPSTARRGRPDPPRASSPPPPPGPPRRGVPPRGARRSASTDGSSTLARGCTPRRIGATRSCPRRRREALRSLRADGKLAARAGPPRRYFHGIEPRRSCPIRAGGRVGGSDGREKERQRPHLGWRR
jgi:hypothetical protein